MVFPQTVLAARAEIFVNSTWTDISDKVYDRDGIVITRGRPDESSTVDPATCNLTVNNITGDFSPRNPLGTYYGSIGRNTPTRVSVRHGDPFLLLTGESGTNASMPDSVATSVTGNIDLRIDFAANNTPAPTDTNTDLALAGKYSTSNQRSWAWEVTSEGLARFTWSTDGTTTNAVSVESAIPIPWGPARRAMRVVLDVDTGSSHAVSFYTSDTINGEWSELGAPVVGVGTTSIFNSTATTRVGELSAISTASPFDGHVYAFEMRDGIDGTIVANPDFTIQTVGDNSFSDTASPATTWTLNANAEITDRNYRFHGEVSAWPQDWDLSGNDVYVTLTAAGILRRLGQGRPALRSALYREYTSPTRPDVVGYWSCEDGTTSTRLGSAFPGHAQGTIAGTPDLSSFPDYLASAPLPVMNDASFSFNVNPYTVTAETAVRVFARMPGGASPSNQRVMSVKTSGTAAVWEIVVGNSTNDFTYKVVARDSANAVILDTGNLQYPTFEGPSDIMYEILLTESGADVLYDINLYALTNASYEFIDELDVSGTLAGRNVRRVTNVTIAQDRGLNESAFGHVVVASSVTAFDGTGPAMVAFVREPAVTRLARLCEEEEVSFTSFGFAEQPSERMGAQTPKSLPTILQECADSDGGMLFEPRDRLGVGYRPRVSLYNQLPQLQLTYDQGELAGSLFPVDDDQSTANFVTVTREFGSEAVAKLETGPLSVQEPPNGVGQYDASFTRSLSDDAQVPDQAGWELHKGTVDAARYPTLSFNLRRNVFFSDGELTERLLRLDQGDRIVVDGLPAWLPPEEISQLVQGTSETMNSFTYVISSNCSPEEPYHVAELNDDVFGHLESLGSTLNSGVTSTATTLSVATSTGPLWSTNGYDYPFDIMVAGERMTVSDTASGVVDTFTRAISNGWGAADSGDVWANSGGAASDYSVDGTTGLVSLGSVSVRRFTTTPAGPNIQIHDSVVTPVTATGASISGGYVARYTDDNNFYLFQILHDTAGNIDLEIDKRVAGVFTVLASASNLITYSPGVPTNVSCLCFDDQLAVKVWSSGSVEPNGYQLAARDTQFSTGSVGTHSNLLTSNTNTLPVVLGYDDVVVTAAGVSGTTSPQTFTVIRSINGVVKAHSAGAEVRLFQPMTLAH